MPQKDRDNAHGRASTSGNVKLSATALIVQDVHNLVGPFVDRRLISLPWKYETLSVILVHQRILLRRWSTLLLSCMKSGLPGQPYTRTDTYAFSKTSQRDLKITRRPKDSRSGHRPDIPPPDVPLPLHKQSTGLKLRDDLLLESVGVLRLERRARNLPNASDNKAGVQIKRETSMWIEATPVQRASSG